MERIALPIVFVLAIVVLVSPACARKKPPQPPMHTKSVRPRPVDPKAQQQYYDLGLQQYSKENYEEARRAFQDAVDAGPATQLGVKAQENIRKIDQILKTLEEMEKK
jgi:Tfp pilus assembly protein PilF